MQHKLAIRGADSARRLANTWIGVRAFAALLLLTTAFLAITAASAAAQTIAFADPNLEGAVRAAVGVPQPVPVTDTDMLRLTNLYAYNSNITSLGGLEYAANLMSLGCDNNQISDLSPLSGLRSLEGLNVASNRISDVSSLANVASLKYIELSNNQVSDASPLAALVNMETLYLPRNDLSDISWVSGLTKMHYLYLNGNQLTSVAPLSTLGQLQELDLSDNQIADVSALTGLVRLSLLRLGGNQISTLAPLADHAQLKSLFCNNNPVADLSALAGCTSLTDLACSYTQVSDLTPLSGMTHLYWLWGDHMLVSDISVLANLTSLQTVNLESNRVSDLTPLSHLPRLANLNLKANRITSIAALSGLPNLGYLWLGGNHVSDVSPLATCPSLTYISLNQNWITDVSPLFGMTGQIRLLDVQMDYLDVSPGSPAMTWFTAIQAAGGSVYYTNQGVIPQTAITPTPASPNGTNGWYVTLPRAAMNSYSPAWVTWTRYTLDATAETTYTAQIAIPEGVHTLSGYSFDSQQMTGPVNAKTFRVDTIAPTVPVLSAAGVTTSASSLSWTPSTDSGSGVAGYTLYAADGTVIDTATDTQFTTDGLAPDTSYSYYVTATDVAGNVSAPSNTITVRTAALDTTPPVTTISGGPFGVWTNSVPVSFNLSATDAGSGVASTLYTLNGGNAQVYSGASVPVSVDGVTEVSYWSTDNADNMETARTATIKIDTVAPSIPVPSLSAVGTSTANLSWTASTDSASGVASYAVYANGLLVAVTTSTELALSGLTPDASYTYYVTSTDIAGNTSAPSDTAIARTEPLDTATPVTTISGGPFDTWTRSVPVSFGLSATDEGGSGVSATYYAVNDGAPIAYTGDVSIATDGVTNVSYWSVDNAGNTETARTASIKIDTTAPSVPVLTLSAVATSTASLLWTAAADYGSGVASYTLHAADGSVIAVTSAMTFVLNGLAPGSTYGYYVTATDAVGNTSGVSNTQTVETPPDTTGNATRTWGFYKTHYNYDVVLFGRMGSAMNLGWSHANPLSDLKDVMGMLQSNPAHNSKKTKRNARSQAIIKTSYQLVAAIFNTRLPHGAPVPTDPVTHLDLITAARNAMAGPYGAGSTAEILRLGDLLETYNSSGDAIDTGDPQSAIGNATPQLTDSQYSYTIPDQVTDY
jgi:internalin A